MNISIRNRLSVFIFASLGVLGALFAVMAYYEVHDALRTTGMRRIEAAATQVADLLAQSAAARLDETRRLATIPEIRDTVFAPANARAPEIVRTLLERNPTVSLWISESDGTLVRRLGAAPQGATPADTPLAPMKEGMSGLQADGRRVWYTTTVTVPSETPDAPPRLLSVQRPLNQSQAAEALERLIGSGASLKFGNASGDLWTDLTVPTAAPPIAAPHVAASFVDEAGEASSGIAVEVPNTPWLLWVSAPDAAMLAPARELLWNMLPITLVLMAAGAVAFYSLSGRIARPITTMARAAESIAAGDYSHRVEIERRDEVGRLGIAFNAMVERVSAAHESLERRVSERTQELERARQELDRFFDLSVDLLCIAGKDGRLRRVNPAWVRILGWPAEELIGVSHLDFVHPEDRSAVGGAATSLATGATTFSFECRYRCKDGSYRWLSWNAVPFPEEGIVYAVGRDITPQKDAEQALQRQAADLAAANNELEAFSYSVSHDLRAPLRHIAGFAALLDKHAAAGLDEQGRRYLTTISSAAAQMGRLVDDLLQFSRMGRTDMHRGTVDLTSTVRQTIAELASESPDRKVEWTVRPLPEVVGDAAMLRLAISNLVQNAYKYTRHRDVARIEIGPAQPGNGEHVIYVKDNGAGFDMAFADKLFGVFQRLHRSDEFEGTGIGLANVRRIIHRHGGRTWAEGAVDHGATFYFSLPAEDQRGGVIRDRAS
ncbi:MAG TPA: ATP-binding protein [Vicinamibacterales bacterium]